MRHQWVFSLVTCLHQVSYHTFYQWVTYDWWEPRLLFSLSVTSANGQQEFPGCYIPWMLEDRGSRSWSRQVAERHYSPAKDGRRDKRRKGSEREGRGGEVGGIPFVNWRQFWLSWFLRPVLGGCVVHFLNLRKQPGRALMEAPTDSMGLAGEALSSPSWVKILLFQSVGSIQEPLD